MYKSRNDIITDRKVGYAKEVKSGTYISWIMIIASLAMGAGFIYDPPSKNGQVVESRVYSEDELFVQESSPKAQIKQVPDRVTSTRNFTTHSNTTRNRQPKRNSSGRTKAQRANTKNCLYWNKKYNEDHSNYSKLMQDDACKRAAIEVKTRPSSQNITVHNSYYQDNRQMKKSANKGASTQRCIYYKQELDKVKAMMRRGYTASQYNRLETARKKWQNRLFDGCKHHSINSY